MRNLFTIALLGLCLALVAGPALADETVSLKAGYLQLTPKGDFAVSSSTLVGTKVSLDNDLGFDDSKDFFAEAALQLGDFRLGASYTPIQFKGNGLLSRSVNFNGQTYNANAQTTSDVKLDVYDLGLTWYLINMDDLPVRLQIGPELSVKYVQADLSITGETTSGSVTATVTESESVNVPIPTVGVRARVGLSDFVGVVGRVGYLKYKDNSFLDADAQLEFSPIPMLGVFAGYRYFDLQVDESDVYIDSTFSGPYAGAMFRF